MSTATTSPYSPGGPPRRTRHRWARMIAAVAVCLGPLALYAPAADASTTITAPTKDTGIITFPGDVYTLNDQGALIPADPTSTAASAALYSLAGNPLNLTWGQWSSATATSYGWTITRGGTTSTDFVIGMSGLVPNGVYSLFYRTLNPDSDNSICPDVEPAIALTSAFGGLQKPDPDSFVASSSGRALFIASVAQNLLAAQNLTISVIYHFNGQTYGPVANAAEAAGPVASNNGLCRSSYGVDAMRQLLIIQK
jgi:hypothetical protein